MGKKNKNKKAEDGSAQPNPQGQGSSGAQSAAAPQSSAAPQSAAAAAPHPGTSASAQQGRSEQDAQVAAPTQGKAKGQKQAQQKQKQQKGQQDQQARSQPQGGQQQSKAPGQQTRKQQGQAGAQQQRLQGPTPQPAQAPQKVQSQQPQPSATGMQPQILQQGQPQQQWAAPAQQGQGTPQWGPPPQKAQAAPQWGPPPQQSQQQWGPPPQQGQAAQQRGPPPQQGQQQQQWGPPLPQAQAAQQRGPPPQQGQAAQQRGPPPQQGQQQQQWGPPLPQAQAAQQRGPPPQQQPRQQSGPQQPRQQAGPQQPGLQQSRPQQAPRKQQTQLYSGQPASGPPPARGTLGEKGECEVNYLELKLDKMPSTAYHYDITIVPDRPKKFFRNAVNKFNEQYFNNITMTFDGRANVFTAQRLPCQSFSGAVEIDDTNGRKISFTIDIQETENSEIDLNSLRTYHRDRVFDKPMRALQCIETVLANPCHSRGVRVGRSFYSKPAEFYDLKDGYEMWIGLYQATILGDNPYMNVDIAHKSFPVGCNLVDHLRNNMRVQNVDAPLDARRDLPKLRNYLRGVNVTYVPPRSFGALPKVFRVNDVLDQSAANLMFEHEGKKMSVAQYFAMRSGKLRFPNLNCLHLGPADRNIYIPLEFCEIAAGQPVNKKDESRQVQEIIRYAATSTDIRKKKIMDMLSRFQHNNDLKIKEFGISIGLNFIRVQTRVLYSPMLEYCNKEEIRPFNGSWRTGPRTNFLVTKAPPSGVKWAIIYDKRSRNIQYANCDALGRLLLDAARAMNLHLDPKPVITPFERLDVTLGDLKKQKFDLVVVIIPFFGTTYADIKQTAELRHGILTQCIKEETVQRRSNAQLAANILLKLNAKLNGINHKITQKSSPRELTNCMFMGADVTHPSPDQRRIPSVVGVAASHDAHGTCYNSQYRLQESACETILDMESICAHHLKIYKQYQNKYPDNIIYYRDGVSDGQFPIIRDVELGAIRSACRKVKVAAKITCIIVVKRHHTRFFPTTVNPKDKFNNVKPGTVVDQKIVHPNEVQFFMVSHQSIQGTAKPTRYNVIVDDAKFNIDMLQSLTYNLCHLFPRCNRVVSYPAPAYLAHLVAYRGRVYIDGANNLQLNRLDQEYNRRLVNTNFMQSNPMYFV